MAFECRLCGSKKAFNELIISLQSESQTVKFVDLVTYFCRVEIDGNPLLPQYVCQMCQTSLEDFMLFCDKVEEFQKTLKQRSYVTKKEIKREAIVFNTLKVEENVNKAVTLETTLNVAENKIPESNAIELFDEDLDSPLSGCQDEIDDTVSESCGYINLRNKTLTKTKDCSVRLERLDIKFVETDSDDNCVSSEGEASPLSKRTRFCSESPGNRMKMSMPTDRKTVSLS